MSAYAAVFTFNSKQDSEIALRKDAQQPVIYYLIAPSFYEWEDATDTWSFLSDKSPAFSKKNDQVTFFFIDSAQAIDQAGVVIDFQQSIGPFDDEVAAELRLAAPVQTTFPTAPNVSPVAFELSPIGGPGRGFQFESEGKYSYTVTVLTFPDLRKYWLDPEMDVDT